MADQNISTDKSFPKLNIFLITLLIFFVILFFGFYFLYQNLPGEPVNLNPIVVKAPVLENQTYLEVKQFYPNMKFNHKQISYHIDSLCDDEKRGRMAEAFDELALNVGLIGFYEVSSAGDIEISCSGEEKPSAGEYFIAGEGGAKEIIQTDRYNIINEGVVILHGNPHSFLECDWANVELHELVHVFGFDHSENPKSLMYRYLEDCNQRLDDSIINELKRLYSEENLADLYFDDVIAVKKRRYIDFNLTVRNSGSINVERANFSVFDDGELIGSFDLEDKEGEIKYGAGIIVSIENLKLKSSNPKEIKFVIDYENLIKEIDEENNVAAIKFDD
jgi:hypothetical protein